MNNENLNFLPTFEKMQEKKAQKQKEVANKASLAEMYICIIQRDIKNVELKLNGINARLEKMLREISETLIKNKKEKNESFSAAKDLLALQKTRDKLIGEKDYLKSRLTGYENILKQFEKSFN